ncbi:hypothetical protein SAMD00019534_092970 [Acytostelium subglobosum LB1]|uniref:hypothetical protein n=1 Tax=Acytostelium subglobosum LB1 TaxID=1410327 RepID=UPI000644B7EC|nr:hypothetical protein SAMD00019534_092970 [Acytostelium subglobosum LB1]GAM26122.1 hypothetical protein SAMD00019534_092970 [Acytostelium subglobosum LB1]|eukprot:XP_012751165.1 hypothetical protein SAMD00019534_092970 [Acytostelium subglobosum LB1]
MIHRQLEIKVIHSSDIVSLYQCVQSGDTAKFIHHCDQLDISIHSPKELLDTINESFYHALHKQNVTLVTYIIELFRDGNTTNDQFVQHVRSSLFSFLRYNMNIELSRPMIHTLLGYLPDIAPPLLHQIMMKTALSQHGDLDLYYQLYHHHQGYDLAPAFQHYVFIGYQMKEFNPMFAKYQSRIINDFIAYLGKPSLNTNVNDDIFAEFLLVFTIKHRLFDLFMTIAKHVNTDPNLDSQYLSASAHPITVATLLALTHSIPKLINRLAREGDLVFLKLVLPLVAVHLDTKVNSQATSVQIFDPDLLQCALTGGHYECALFILDNFTQYLALLPSVGMPGWSNEVGDTKWTVTSINMSNDHDHNWPWPDLIERLVGHISVECRFKDLYSDAIKARRMDVIELFGSLISSNRVKVKKDTFDSALSIAIREQYCEAIEAIIHYRPSFKYISLMDIDQCTSNVQDMLLASIPPGSIIFDNTTSIPNKIIDLSPTTIRMLIKHQHHPQCWRTLLRSAELLDDRELIGILGNHGYGTTSYKGDPWTLGYDLDVTTRNRVQPTVQDYMLYVLLNQRTSQRAKIDRLLASPKHNARVDKHGHPAIMGQLMRDDVIELFNMKLQPDDPPYQLIPYRADVSHLDMDLIEFIWSRLNDSLKQDQQFIISVLSSTAAINNFKMYRYVIDQCLTSVDIQEPFIQVPSIQVINENIQLYRRYSSITSIIQLFRPDSNSDDQSTPTSPYHRLHIPLVQSEFQQYQLLLTNLGVFNPSQKDECNV